MSNKTFLPGLIFLFALLGEAKSQSMNYVAGGAVLGGELIEMPDLILTIDSVNSRTIWAGDYKQLITHFTYGFQVVKKHNFLEYGGSLIWGNTKESFVDGDNPADPATQINSWWIRQRMINLNLRAGLALGDRISVGAEAGGVLSNFQHLKLKSSSAPLWVIKFSGTRSFVGLATAYLSVRFPTDGLIVEVQPYYTWGLGKISFKDVFDPEIYSPSNDLPNESAFKCIGFRLFIGLCKEQ